MGRSKHRGAPMGAAAARQAGLAWCLEVETWFIWETFAR